MSHSVSKKETRKNQVALIQQRFASLLFCCFIQAVKGPATQGAAIPQQQNSQHNKLHEIQHSWKRKHKILCHILGLLQLAYHSLALVAPCQLQEMIM